MENMNQHVLVEPSQEGWPGLSVESMRKTVIDNVLQGAKHE